MLIAEFLAELMSPIDLDRDSQTVANDRLNLEHTTQSLMRRAASHRTNRSRFSVHHLLLIRHITAQDIRDVMCASIHVDVAGREGRRIDESVLARRRERRRRRPFVRWT